MWPWQRDECRTVIGQKVPIGWLKMLLSQAYKTKHLTLFALPSCSKRLWRLLCRVVNSSRWEVEVGGAWTSKYPNPDRCCTKGDLQKWVSVAWLDPRTAQSFSLSSPRQTASAPSRSFVKSTRSTQNLVYPLILVPSTTPPSCFFPPLKWLPGTDHALFQGMTQQTHTKSGTFGQRS
jgi:hypothetical protein